MACLPQVTMLGRDRAGSEPLCRAALSGIRHTQTARVPGRSGRSMVIPRQTKLSESPQGGGGYKHPGRGPGVQAKDMGTKGGDR